MVTPKEIDLLIARAAHILARALNLALQPALTPEEIEGKDGFDLLELVGRKRGMLQSGGVVNTERAAIMLLDEFRGGKLGRITLEKPPKFTPAAREQEQNDAE